MNRYEIKGGEPEFGPVQGKEVGEINGRLCSYLLVRLDQPAKFEGLELNELALAPRYEGDTLETIRKGTSTVSICYCHLKAATPDQKSDVRCFSIGSCTLL